MFEITKWYLYYLIEMMTKKKIDEDFFCSELYAKYGKDPDRLDLSTFEKNVFSEIELVSSRFSSNEADHKNHPGVFYTKEDLYKAVLSAAKKLGVLSNP